MKLGQWIISDIEKLQFTNAQIIPILYRGGKCFYDFFLIMQSFTRELSAVLQTLKMFVRGVKGAYTPPFFHLWTRGILTWETKSLILSNY